MATYGKTSYGRVSNDEGLYESPGLIKWNKLLEREHLYKFDNNIMDNDYLLTLPLISKIKDLPYATFTITSEYDGRPDVLAFKQYGDSDYWWIVMAVNNIDDFEKFVSGLEVRLPVKNYLDEFLTNIYFQIEKSKRKK